MNFLDPQRRKARVMEQIRKVDEALGSKIQDLMFVFDNLIEVDDRGMQELLREVPGDRLLLAMKGAEEALKEKIFKNMSQRAAEMLQGRPRSQGPGAALAKWKARRRKFSRSRASWPKPARSSSAARARSSYDSDASRDDRGIARWDMPLVSGKPIQGRRPGRTRQRARGIEQRSRTRKRYAQGREAGLAAARAESAGSSSNELKARRSRAWSAMLGHAGAAAARDSMREVEQQLVSLALIDRAAAGAARTEDRSGAGHRRDPRDRRRCCRLRRATCAFICIPKMPRWCASVSPRRRRIAPGPSSRIRS